MAIFRFSQYEGTPSTAVSAAAEGAGSMIGAGSATYVASTFRGNTAGRYDNTSGPIVMSMGAPQGNIYWTAWVRLQSAPTDIMHLMRVTVGTSGRAGVGINTSRQPVLRFNAGGTVGATSSVVMNVGVWYGFRWQYLQSTEIQTLQVYDENLDLLDTINSQGSTTFEFDGLREGAQSAGVAIVDLDDTIVADEPAALTAPPTTTTAQFVYFDGATETPLQAVYFDGTDEAPLTPDVVS
jgi:hypothetical protein